MADDREQLLCRVHAILGELRGAAQSPADALGPTLAQAAHSLLEIAGAWTASPPSPSQATTAAAALGGLTAQLSSEPARTDEEPFRNLFETINEGFALHEILCDGQGTPTDYRFLAVNPAFEQQTGLKAADLLGRTVLEVLPGTEPLWIERFGRVAVTGEADRFESYSRELKHWYSVQAYRTEPGKFAVLCTNITERKRTQQALARQNEMLAGINRILEAVVTSADDEEFGMTCLAVAESVTHSSISLLGEIGSDGTLQDIAISNPGWAACKMYDPQGHRQPPGDLPIHGIFRQVLTDGRLVVTNDPPSHPDSVGLPEGHPPLTSLLGVPLLQDDRVSGMLAVGNRQGGYGPAEQEALQGLAPVIREAIARRRAERTLEERESFYRQALESMPGMVFTTRPDGYCDYQSQQWVAFTGVPMDQHLGNGWNRLLHPDDQPRAFAAWRAAVEERGPYDLEYRVRKYDGSYEWFKVHGRPIRDDGGGIVRWFGTALNIHSLVEAQGEVRRRTERFRLLSKTAARLLASEDPQAILRELCTEIMGHLGCQVFCSFLVDETAGRMRLNACGGEVAEGGRQAGWVDHALAINEQCATAGKAILVEVIPGTTDPRADLLRPHGIQAYCCQPMTAQGKVLGTLSFGTTTRAHFTPDEIELMRTVTDQIATAMERLRTQDSLRRAMEAAEAASRAKSEFLARMSHEIRTPLNGVMGMLELALMEGVPPKSREHLGLARQSATHLLEIINDILDLSRIEAGRVELHRAPFALRRLVTSVVSTLEVAARQKGLRLTCHFDPAIPDTLLGDEGRLRQVLTNLVGNAVKFTERGEVAIRVEMAAAGQAGDEDGAAATVTLGFQVRDTGIGIPRPNLDSLFDSFSQATNSTHTKYGGTGLGLSIAKQLVELMEGEIRVDSAPGKGSCFSFTTTLGTAGEAAPAPQPEVAAVPPRPGQSLRILLAEDNPINRRVACSLLEAYGHRVTAVTSGVEVLAALTEAAYDGILMDVQMPAMDGLETTRRIRRGEVPGGAAELPIVALTAHALAGDRDRFLAAGMDDCVSKPVTADALLGILAGWEACTRDTRQGPAPGGRAAGSEELQERFRDLCDLISPAQAGALAELIRDEVPGQMAAVTEAAARADAPRLASAVHTLRGSLAHLGSRRMAELCAQLETVAERGVLDGVTAVVEHLQTEFGHLMEFLEALRTEPN